jgi:pimeloyl-ACP methyl ester carboxylesterase
MMALDGLSVHYEVQGQGPYVFLLHGWGANLSLFDDLASAMASHYTVVRVDFPGCGNSSEPDHPWGMDDYVRFVSAFIATFGSCEIILLGHSHGGRVAIRLATDEGLPFTVVKMILVGSAGILPKRSFVYHLRVRSYKMGKAILTWGPVSKLFPESLGRFPKAQGSTDYATASPVMRASLVKVVNADLLPLLSKITAETLLIWGELDTETPVSNGETMEKHIPGSGLVVLKGAGHYVFLDQAYTFRRVIESFLQIG